MLVARSMDPGWLSNTHLVATSAVVPPFVDGVAPLQPLLQQAEERGVTPSHVRRTRAHGDHVTHEDKPGFLVGGSRVERS